MTSEVISMPVPAAISQVDPVIHVLERIVRDTSIPIERLEAVEALLERRLEQQNRCEFDIAMAAAQEEMQPVARDSLNPSTKSKYASYTALDRAIRPIYSKHGFALSFNTKSLGADEILITCEVTHNGYTKHYEIPMPRDGKGAKGGEVMTRTHATGSAATYGQRYLLKLIFNVAIGEYDDDGNLGPQSSDDFFVTPEQAAYLEKLIKKTGRPIERFCQKFRLDKIEQLPASKYDEAVAFLKQYIPQEN